MDFLLNLNPAKVRQVDSLLSHFKINLDKVQTRNEQLLAYNLMKKLNPMERDVLSTYKMGDPSYLNKDGLLNFVSFSQFLAYPDQFGFIDIKQLREFIITYRIKLTKQNIKYYDLPEELEDILKTIQKRRIEAITKYVRVMDKAFKKGIECNDTVFRVMSYPFESNVIKNFTSWSLVPLIEFCGNETCHVYVTKVPKFVKILYAETDWDDPTVQIIKGYTSYEYDFVFPRDLLFRETSTEMMKIPNFNFNNKHTPKRSTVNVQVHYITITKQLPLAPLPQHIPLKLRVEI